MAEETVKERLDSGKQYNDMLGSFLSHGMSPKQAEAEILTQLYVRRGLEEIGNLFVNICYILAPLGQIQTLPHCVGSFSTS